MVILVHSYSIDLTTNHVLDWLYYYSFPFFRLNGDKGYKISFQKEQIFIESINIKQIRSYWYRKGAMMGLDSIEFHEPQIRNLLEESRVKVLQYIEYTLCEKKHLNRFFNSNPSKLFVLEKAKKTGLKIPHFVLSNNLIESGKKYIYKPINEGVHLELEDYIGNVYTEVYDKKKKQEFGLTFFQEFIEKKYELRIFYLNGRFYSMAIMSQKDKQTKIDFRHYNEERPNRNVPFKLPEEIEEKLDLLMKYLNLKSGSIDMIVSKDREYYFLEVNPVGQFGMVSYPCNYYLEKEIAEYLSYD